MVAFTSLIFMSVYTFSFFKRFQKDDVHRLKHALGVPQMIMLENGSKMEGSEALCITLQRYAYPCRYGDLIKGYGRPVPHLCLIFKWMTDFIYQAHQWSIFLLDQPWLSPQFLEIL